VGILIASTLNANISCKYCDSEENMMMIAMLMETLKISLNLVIWV
jgi:hypothetical protein